MITVEDIDTEYPETREGSLYTNMYKEHYGRRPRGITWNTEDEFFGDFERLSEIIAQKATVEQWDDEELTEGMLTAELGYDPLESKRNSWDWD